MGKMKGDIYKYYMLKYDANDPANSSPRLPKWECRFCSKQYVQNATKMRHHVLNMCEEIPAPLKLALLDIPNVNVLEDSNEEAKMFINSLVGNQAQSDQPNQSLKKPSLKQPLKKRKSLQSSSLCLPGKLTQIGGNLDLIPSVNDTVSALCTLNNEQESLWVLMARAIYASGSSLTLLENPYWVEVFQRISPDIKLPSKELIGKDLLDSEVAKIEADVEKHISDAKYVGIQCEAWLNSRSESILTFGVTTPVSFSYKTIPTGAAYHNEVVISERAINVIKDIQASQSVVLSLVTTTVDHMKFAWPKIQSVFPNLIIFSCVVESLGLLLEDILEQPHIGVVLDVIKLVVTKIKHSSLLKSKFENVQSQLSIIIHKLYLTNRSKSISYITSLQSVLKTQSALKWLAMDEESVQIVGEELSLLVSDEFWTKIEILVKLLFPIIKWYNLIRDGKPEIALVPKAFAEIKNAFDILQNSVWEQDVYPYLIEIFNTRKHLSMQSVHLAANLLDPRQQGSSLDQDQVLQATEFIDTFCDQYKFDSGAVIAELSQYRMKTEFYSKPFLWKVTEKVPSSVWWSTMAPKTDLAQLATAILNICPSTFSTDPSFTGIHLDWSNSSRDCKLVYVSHNLRIRSKLASISDANKRARSGENSTNFEAGSSSSSESKPSNGIIDWSSADTICTYTDSESEDEEEIKKECVALTSELYT